ncbi:MAG: hypothetical protein WDK96_00630 [Candidatus Paceibacterota bacterium]|jgi:hypothetical protein
MRYLELIEKGWEDLGVTFANCPILKNNNRRIVFDLKTDSVVIEYILDK